MSRVKPTERELGTQPVSFLQMLSDFGPISAAEEHALAGPRRNLRSPR